MFKLIFKALAAKFLIRLLITKLSKRNNFTNNILTPIFYIFKRSPFSIFALIFIFSLMGCGRLNPETRITRGDNFAAKNNFLKNYIDVEGFKLVSYSKITDPNQAYVVYLEGDGLAYINRYTPSDNPTPNNLMLLKLATLDRRPNIIYIARPCQFTLSSINPKCQNIKYWTTDRFSEESVNIMNQAVIKSTHAKPVHLVGFSGGGAIAVLIGAKNNKVASITTIAGNLDHEAFNAYNHVSPMYNSLNPIKFIDKVKHIPQLHLAGAKDTRVPPFISTEYVKKANSHCIKGEIIKNATHDKGWENAWSEVLTQPLNCD